MKTLIEILNCRKLFLKQRLFAIAEEKYEKEKELQEAYKASYAINIKPIIARIELLSARYTEWRWRYEELCKIILYVKKYWEVGND